MASEAEIRDALYDVMDPELNINIVDLGLVYGVEVLEENVAKVNFTLTYPGCPLGDQISQDMIGKILNKTDVSAVQPNLVWLPAWNQDMMSDNAKLMFGYPI